MTIGIILVLAISPFLVNQVFAEMNVTERMDNYEITQINNSTWITKLGLPTHIQDNQGNWIANIFTEDANGLQLESGSMSYYFDKNSCTMSLFNSGTITNQSDSIINGDIWIVKQALNGTENWTDVSQNNLACTVSNTIQGDMIEINSTKSDVNGTISEIYHYDKYKGLKHTIYFTNNDPSLTNHKFSFSNKLQDIPKSFTTMVITDQANYTASFDSYSVLDSQSQPFQFGGNGTVMDFSASEVVQYDAIQYSANSTQFYHGFNMIENFGGNDTRTIVYDFGDGFQQLSEVKFQSLPDQTIDVYIHYANVTSILPVSGTISLDPIINFDGSSGFSVRRAVAQGTGSCTGATFRGADTIFTHEVRSFGGAGASKICRLPMMFMDISSIPDNATPTRITFSLNITSSQTQGFDEITKDNGNWFSYLTEDLLNVSDSTLSSSLIQGFAITAPDGEFWYKIEDNIFRYCAVNTCPDILIANVTSPTATSIVNLKVQLDSGRDFLQHWTCQQDTARPCGFSTNQVKQQLANFDQATTSLEIEYEIFTVPDEPENVSATFSPTPDECLVDWDQPLFDGGHPLGLLSYEIDRNINNGVFFTLVSGLPLIPTDFTDSTIVIDESYKYRVSATNTEGEGAFAETASCGFPAISDPPVGLIAFEEPQNDITLDWETAPFDGALPVLGYQIERSVSGGAFTILVANTNSQDTIFVNDAVQANIEFTYRISQINSLGTSLPSNESSFTIVVSTGAGGGGQGSQTPVQNPELELEPDQTFEEALAMALAEIPPQQITIIETIVQTFFEFAVVDDSHDDVFLNSFLQNERLGIRWSSGQDIVIASAIPAPSPFLITFEQFPVLKQGSGAVVSTDFLVYNLQVPTLECGDIIQANCIEKARYEVPITVNAILNGTNVSDVGTITIDLTDEILDPVLLIILAVFFIPLIGAIIQRARGRSTSIPLRKVVQSG